MCGLNRVLKTKKRLEKGKPELFQWPTIDLDTAFILQTRIGGGKIGGSGAKGRGKAPGTGFHLVPSESLTLAEMLHDRYEKSIVEAHKTIERT